MPVIFSFIERLPVPSLKKYAGFSSILLLGIFYYSYDTVINDKGWQVDLKQKIVDNGLSDLTREWLLSSAIARIIYFMLTDQVCIWTVVNTACCALVLIGKMLQTVVFGRLRVLEHHQMRDRFWNFVFYKFVFVFGVMNVQYFDEVFMWSIWFALCGFFYLLTSLAQDRFKYVSLTHTSDNSTNVRILVFLTVILFCNVGLCGVALMVSFKYGWNYGAFLAAECITLLLRVTHGLLRYGLHVYDTNRQINCEERNTLAYYTDLIVEMAILVSDFLHHLHMLIWSNIFLSMGSLVIGMQLRYLYQEIDVRLRRHRNFQRIVNYIDSKYPMATLNDLHRHDDKCAICWDRMEAARKLTCGHMFHNWCLHGWLEQDTSCPTCRTILSVTPPGINSTGQAVQAQDPMDVTPPVQRRRHTTNHFFHFDGRRYARWLPSFSVEVSHNISRPAILRRNVGLDHSQLTRMVEQVRELFPTFPMDIIEDDLRETNNVEMTVDNILNGRISSAEDEIRSNELNLASDDDVESEYDESDGLSLNGGETSSVESHDQSATASSTVEPSTSGAFRPPTYLDVGVGADSAVLGDVGLLAAASSSRFSKRTDEREIILDNRKMQLIHLHRRKYINSSRGSDLLPLLSLSPHSGQFASSEFSTSGALGAHSRPAAALFSASARERADHQARRRMLFNAARRHLPQHGDG